MLATKDKQFIYMFKRFACTALCIFNRKADSFDLKTLRKEYFVLCTMSLPSMLFLGQICGNNVWSHRSHLAYFLVWICITIKLKIIYEVAI